MKKSWLRRLLLSYLPVLILIVSLFVFVGIVQLNELSRKEAEKSNRLYVKNLQSTVEMSLRSIEMMMLEAISRNQVLTSYVAMQSDAKFILELSQTLQSMVNTHPWIHSAYLYRAGDRTIVSSETKLALESFGDRAYIEEHLQDTGRHAWSSPRLFHTLPHDDGEGMMISMSKGVPIQIYGQALLVVNVSLNDIQHFLRQNGASEVYHIRMTDAAGNTLYEQGEPSDSKLSFSMKSDYTGWTYQGGLNGQTNFLFSYLSDPYVLVGFLLLAGAIVWVIYITRRSYKPIETMVSRIRQYNEQHTNRPIPEPPGDELVYIDQTLSSIMEASQSFESGNRENAEYRRLRLLQELVEGDERLDREKWQQELAAVGLRDGFGWACVALFEIDKYVEFISQFSRRDQSLFKYIMKKAIDETTTEGGLQVWQEWIDHRRLCVIVILRNGEPQTEAGLLATCDQIRQWLDRHLSITVTAGVGPGITHIDDIASSYGSARKALEYKTALGGNRIISHREIDLLQPADLYAYLQYVPSIAQSFRSGTEGWREQLEQFFDGIKKLMLPREEINGLLAYLNYYFHREMLELPADYQEIWNDEFHSLLMRQPENLETIDELSRFYIHSLHECAVKLQEKKAQRGNQGTVTRMRQFIEQNYHDPDLSLSQFSDMFSMSPSALSMIFKEEFGEKFIVFLCKVRMEQAKLLLRETSFTIQDISEKVGYVHQMSFNRAFKKTVGMTPGEYRKTFD